MPYNPNDSLPDNIAPDSTDALGLGRTLIYVYDATAGQLRAATAGDLAALPSGAATQTTLAAVLAALSGTLATSRANQAPTSTTVSFLTGAGGSTSTLTTAATLNGQSVFRVTSGSTWAAADITFMTSPDGVTFTPLYDEYGTIYTVKMAASRSVYIAPSPLLYVAQLRIVATAAQTANTPLTIMSAYA